MKTIILTTTLLVLITHAVIGGKKDVSDLIAANRHFSARLYHEIVRDKCTFIYSPLSIHSLLAMVSIGADRETDTEMNDILGLNLKPVNDPHAAFQELMQTLKSSGQAQLKEAYAIFISPGDTVNNEFLEQLEMDYAAITQDSALNSNEEAVRSINEYMSNITRHNNLLPKDSINENTCMLLASATSFNGFWENPFSKSENRVQNFYQQSGKMTKVNMMTNEQDIRTNKRKTNGVNIAQLAIKGGRFAFYIMLHKDVKNTTKLEQMLVKPGLRKLLKGLKTTRAQVSIPKFNINTKLFLKKNLHSLGMQKAFDANSADFSGISKDDSIAISEVIHQAVLGVTEDGFDASQVDNSPALEEIPQKKSVYLYPKEAVSRDFTVHSYTGGDVSHGYTVNSRTDEAVSHGYTVNSGTDEAVSPDIITDSPRQDVQTGDVAVDPNKGDFVPIDVIRDHKHVPHKFTADHPFLFFIMDLKSGCILLQGKFSGY